LLFFYSLLVTCLHNEAGNLKTLLWVCLTFQAFDLSKQKGSQIRLTFGIELNKIIRKEIFGRNVGCWHNPNVVGQRPEFNRKRKAMKKTIIAISMILRLGRSLNAQYVPVEVWTADRLIEVTADRLMMLLPEPAKTPLSEFLGLAYPQLASEIGAMIFDYPTSDRIWKQSESMKGFYPKPPQGWFYESEEIMLNDAKAAGRDFGQAIEPNPNREAILENVLELIRSNIIREYSWLASQTHSSVYTVETNLTPVLREQGIALDLAESSYYSLVNYYVADLPLGDEDAYSRLLDFWVRTLVYSQAFLEGCGISLIHDLDKIDRYKSVGRANEKADSSFILFVFARKGIDEKVKSSGMKTVQKFCSKKTYKLLWWWRLEELAENKTFVKSLKEIPESLPSNMSAKGGMIIMVEKALIRGKIYEGEASYAVAIEAVTGVFPNSVSEWLKVQCVIVKPFKSGVGYYRYRNLQNWVNELKGLFDLLSIGFELSDSLQSIIIDASDLGYKPSRDSIPIGFVLVQPLSLCGSLAKDIKTHPRLAEQAEKTRFIYVYIKCNGGDCNAYSDRILNVVYIGAKKLSRQIVTEEIIGEILKEYPMVEKAIGIGESILSTDSTKGQKDR
jgi:hypothetical protein